MKRLFTLFITLFLISAFAITAYFSAQAIFGSIVKSRLSDEDLQIIKKASDRYGLNCYVLLGVILTESGGNHLAQSRAGARGWTQVIPSTARGIAPRAGIPYSGPNDLFNKETSANLGAYYMAALIRTYGSEYNAYVAYNGGPARVGKPPEQLPKETRAYPGKVSRNKLVAQELFPGLCNPSGPITIPVSATSNITREQFEELEQSDIPDETGINPRDLNALWRFFLNQ